MVKKVAIGSFPFNLLVFPSTLSVGIGGLDIVVHSEGCSYSNGWTTIAKQVRILSYKIFIYQYAIPFNPERELMGWVVPALYHCYID